MDRARRDAAPRRDAPEKQAPAPASGGGGSSGPTSGGSGTVDDAAAGSIRSENNFGTSSEVPGATKKHERSRQGGGSGDQDGAAGSGASEAVQRAAGLGASTTATDGPSDDVVYPLLAALLAVGAGIGIFAGHRAHRGRRSD